MTIAEDNRAGGTPEKPYNRGPFKGLTPNVIKLGIVSFFADVSSEMIYPLTPIFLTTVLGAPMAVVGLIEGVAEAIASIMKTVSGRMSDRTGRRRPFVFVGYLLSAVAKPLIALAGGWALVFVARFADRFGKGLRTSSRDALIADSVDAKTRGLAFGWHRAFDTMGAVIGPLLAILCVKYVENLRFVFLWALVPGIIGALIVLFVKERRTALGSGNSTFKLSSLPTPFRRYLVAWSAFSIANSSDIFLILKAKQVGYSTALVIAVYAFYNLTYALASPYLGHLSDKMERKNLLALGLIAFAAVYVGFALVVHPWQMWVLFGIYGLYMAATDGVSKALAIDLVEAEVRATAVGVMSTFSGIAALIASTVAGVLWNAVGSWAAFVYGAVGAIVGAMMLFKIPKIVKASC